MIRTDAEAPLETTADVCIVGAGAAGLAIAAELIGTSCRVVVLESGARSRSDAADELNDVSSVGVPHLGGVHGRARVLGGATTLWGGQLIPLRASETRARAWVPHSGWPFAPEVLAPYYRRVEKLLGVPGPPYDERVWPLIGTPAPRFDSSEWLFRFSQWAPLARRNLALLLRARLEAARNVEIVLGATVTDIVPDAGGTRIERVEARAADGRPLRVRASTFVVCCGGIETPRRLLAAGGGRGIANRSGLVGRFFQDHISYIAAEISPGARAAVRRHFEPRYRQGSMYTCKIEPTDRTLAAHELLNVMAHVKFELPEALGLLEVKRILSGLQQGKVEVPSLDATFAMARGGVELTRLAFARALLSKRVAPSRGKLLLLVDVEQAPNPASRIYLSEDTDRHGVRKAVVDWRLDGQELDTIARFTRLLAPAWQRAGLGTLALAPEPSFELRDVAGAARDIYHHMGGTRIGADARSGVVDANLKCHDLENLFVASGAVFPAGGIANPTFTVLALGLRLADHLKARLAADAPRPTQSRNTTAARLQARSSHAGA